jgi:hypothetical protein
MTKESVPGLREVFRRCELLVVGDRSTFALLARIVHPGPEMTTAVGAELAGRPAPAEFDAVSTTRTV